MFRPSYPKADTYTTPVIPTRVDQPVAPASTVPASAPVRPTAGHLLPRTPGTAVALVGGGVAAVLVVGSVLVSLLLAVAITAASVAVCAVVLRSLLNGQHHR